MRQVLRIVVSLVIGAALVALLVLMTWVPAFEPLSNAVLLPTVRMGEIFFHDTELAAILALPISWLAASVLVYAVQTAVGACVRLAEGQDWVSDKFWEMLSVGIGGVALISGFLGLWFSTSSQVDLPFAPVPQFVLMGLPFLLAPIGLAMAIATGVSSRRIAWPITAALLSIGALLPFPIFILLGVWAVANM